MTEPQTLTIRRPDDAHLHLRDGAALAAVAPHSARQFGRAVVMPNLRSPVVSAAQALAYQARIEAAVPEGCGFRPLMTLYMTDALSVDEVERAVSAGIVAIKLYPAGATTNSAAGVTDLRRVAPVLDAMQRLGLPLSLHGEVTNSDVDVFDREKVFIDRHLAPMRRDFPELKIVMEHMTTAQAVHYVAEAGPYTAGTITPQHLLFSRNALFLGGLRPHHYCLPVLKREEHRLALVRAATSGSDRYFLGTDSAPHAATLKEHAVGCAGCYTGYNALELYAEVFDRAGSLDKLDAFAGEHAARFYGWPPNTGTVTLRKTAWTVPESFPFGDAELKPLWAGETLAWQFVDPGSEPTPTA